MRLQWQLLKPIESVAPTSTALSSPLLNWELADLVCDDPGTFSDKLPLFPILSENVLFLTLF